MTGLEIIIPIISTIGALAAYKGATKLKIKLSYKITKRKLYHKLKKHHKSDFGKFQDALQKLKQFDIDNQVDKVANLLEKLGVPEEITDSIDKWGDWVEERKDKVIELLEESVEEEKQSEESQMITVLEESVEKTFEIYFNKLALPLKQIDEFNGDVNQVGDLLKMIKGLDLTKELNDLKNIVSSNMKREIPKELNVDKLFQQKMKMAALRKVALLRQRAANQQRGKQPFA